MRYKIITLRCKLCRISSFQGLKSTQRFTYQIKYFNPPVKLNKLRTISSCLIEHRGILQKYTKLKKYTHTHTHTYIYKYNYPHVLRNVFFFFIKSAHKILNAGINMNPFVLQQEGAFLVRDCSKSTAREPYVLVVFYDNRVFNIQIRFDQSTQKYSLGTGLRTHDTFDSVADIIKFHSIFPVILIDGRNPRNDQQKRNCVLMYPSHWLPSHVLSLFK
uniref:SH2 domain-containing protein n=1 Tax=Denticeps clupeoides TaxID=299321 RepID=A0AAY4E7G7_9TELE